MRVPGGGARPPRPQVEAAFQTRVVQHAEKQGWDWMHVPRSRVSGHGRGTWRTQITGTIGRGWPDLFLVRGGRILFLELKTDRGIVDDDQRRVHAVLGQAAEVHVIRPRDWDRLVSLLA